jgi:hypothetical protein
VTGIAVSSNLPMQKEIIIAISQWLQKRRDADSLTGSCQSMQPARTRKLAKTRLNPRASCHCNNWGIFTDVANISRGSFA